MFKSFIIILLLIFFPFLVPFSSFLLVVFVIKRLIKIANYELIEQPKLIVERMFSFKEIKLADRPLLSPDNFIFYKDCFIESFANGKFYRVLTPEVVDVGRNFSSLKEAQKEVDLVR